MYIKLLKVHWLPITLSLPWSQHSLCYITYHSFLLSSLLFYLEYGGTAGSSKPMVPNDQSMIHHITEDHNITYEMFLFRLLFGPIQYQRNMYLCQVAYLPQAIVNTKCSSHLHKKATTRPYTETAIYSVLITIYFRTQCKPCGLCTQVVFLASPYVLYHQCTVTLTIWLPREH